MEEISHPVRTAIERGPSGDFRELACRYLEEYVSKICACLGRLEGVDVWRRSHESTNSIANLLLHLRGNLSLWILHGLGGEPDDRRRSLEFSARDTASGSELLEALEAVVDRSTEVVRGLDEACLDEIREIQGYRTDGLGALFHAVEHMSYHTGQIVAMTKDRLGSSSPMEFYPHHANE